MSLESGELRAGGCETDVWVFANPFSGSGPNRAWVERFTAELRAVGLRPRLHWAADDRVALLRGARQAWLGRAGSNAGQSATSETSDGKPAEALPPWVVAAGGDGSVGAVLNDMAAAGVRDWPFATLPVGNENLFARHFGIQRKRPELLAEAIARGWTRPVDLGRFEAELEEGGASVARRFTLMLSAGFDADVVHRVDAWRNATAQAGELRRVSFWSYVPRSISAVRQYVPARVRLTPGDGQHAGQTLEAAHAFVFNLPEYGKDLGICRQARPDDGQLDYVLFLKPGRLRLLGYLAATALNARHVRRSDVLVGRCSSLVLSSADPRLVPLQADGDPAGRLTSDTSVAVSAEPAALRVVHTTA